MNQRNVLLASILAAVTLAVEGTSHATAGEPPPCELSPETGPATIHLPSTVRTALKDATPATAQWDYFHTQNPAELVRRINAFGPSPDGIAGAISDYDPTATEFHIWIRTGEQPKYCYKLRHMQWSIEARETVRALTAKKQAVIIGFGSNQKGPQQLWYLEIAPVEPPSTPSIAGDWIGALNGFNYRIKFEQDGQRLRGTFVHPDGVADSSLSGSLDGNRIEFVRRNYSRENWKQTYVGFVFHGAVKGQGMAGTFGTGSRTDEAGWYLLREQSDEARGKTGLEDSPTRQRAARTFDAGLANRGFEDGPSHQRWPEKTGIWSGKWSKVVGAERGIQPRSGSKMLRFDCTSWGVPGPCPHSQVNQIIDLGDYKDDVRQGLVTVKASAWFNRIKGGPKTDTRFQISVFAYRGPISDNFLNYDKGRYIAVKAGPIETDGDPETWEKAETELLVPKDADYVVIDLVAFENVSNETDGPEFDGHYVDDVSATIVVVGPSGEAGR